MALQEVDRKFVEWLNAGGVKLDGADLHYFPDTGRGVIATKDLKKGRSLRNFGVIFSFEHPLIHL